MEKRLWSFIAVCFAAFSMAFAQKTVSGQVFDAETGETIVHASVLVSGTTMGAATDMDGKFTINNVPNDAKTLRVTYVGMEEQIVAIKPNLKIYLVSNAKQVDEVMVVAFGTATKSSFTGSATVVGAEDLAKSQVTSATSALAGAVPGLQLTSNNGDPSSEPTIRIRGFSSMSAGLDPLIIVDGAPYNGYISNINPNDIESMTVLKDAASTALYGARGANGVVIINTKKGKGGDAVITLDAKFGWNSRALQHYNTINDPAAYYEMHYDALKNYYKSRGMSDNEAWIQANSVIGSSQDGGFGTNIWTVPDGQMLIGNNGKLNPRATLGRLVNYNGEDYWIVPDNWEKAGTRTGNRQEYNVSINSSNEKSSFYMSLGYLNNEGITYGSDLQRFTGRLKADYQAKKWLKVGANMSYTRFDQNYLRENGNSTSTSNVWAFASQMAPIYPAYIRNGDGSIKLDDNGYKMMDFGTGENGGQTRQFIFNANPIITNILNTNNEEGNAASANAFADITFFPGLVLTVNGTFNLTETRYTEVLNPYYGQFASTGGTVVKEHDRFYNYDMQQLLNYTKTFADVHNLNVMLGHEYYDSRNSYLYASKSNMFSQDNKELNGAVVDGQSSGSYRNRYNNEGWMARLQYDYDLKYFLSGSFRRDASSRFHPDHRWGSFWSAGAAWLMEKEKWFTASWVDQLKIKASIGSQGNDNISNYLYTDRYDIVNSGGNIGTSFGGKGTKDITWETNRNLNAGVEFQLFKKLSGSVEYYYRKTTDMLYSFSVAPSLGYSSYYDNVGDLYNTGVEVTLNYNPIRTKNIDWNINFNIASLKNRISMLHDDKKTSVEYDKNGKVYEGYGNSTFVSEGASMYTFRMKEYAGVDKTTGESLWYKNIYETDANGKEIWYDRNGNVLGSAEDDPHARRKVIGRETTNKWDNADYYVTNETTIPKFYGGFGTSLKAYGFDFSINCSFQIGGKQYDSTYASFMSSVPDYIGYNIHKDVYKSWTADNTDTNIPRHQYNDTDAARRSTRFLTNASYLNIENINFGYTFPKKITMLAQVTSLRLYVAAENVFYWSKRKGFDPRQSYSDDANASYYSPMRTISAGVTLQF